ncbi:MAG: TIM barrel protein [SAR324 cluster bacterium]|nr:TIM barrel protein [SAR324 cluster bacterium]
MEKQLELYMRMGIVHFMAFPELAGGKGPWVDTVRQIALDPFFNAIEITHIEDPETRAAVRDLIQISGLSVGYGAHPAILGQGLDINTLDEVARSQACNSLKTHLDEAIYMGAESFVILSGKDPGQEQREEALKALVKSLHELCVYSREKRGPKIVLEGFDATVDKCCLFGPADIGRRIAQEVCTKNDNFGILVDLSHIPLLEESPAEALGPVKEYLVGAHIGNAITEPSLAGYGDNHPAFGTPGSANGLKELVVFLKTLLDVNFLNEQTRPIVSFEIKPFEGQDPGAVIAGAQRLLRRAWDLT